MNIKRTVDSLVAASAAKDWANVSRLVLGLDQALKKPQGTLDLGDGFRLLEALGEAYRFGAFNDASSGMTAGAEKIIDTLLEAARSGTHDPSHFRRTFDELHALLADPAVRVEPENGQNKMLDLLGELKDLRAFDLLARLCDRLMTRGDERSIVRIHYAQSLIEKDCIHAAITVLGTLLNRPGLETALREKAQGMLGRAHKQIYVNHAGNGTNTGLPVNIREALRESIRSYGAVFDRQKPTETENSRWAAVNLAGVLHLAEQDGIPPPVGTTDTVVGISTALVAKFGDDKDLQELAQKGAARFAKSDTEAFKKSTTEAWKAVTLAESYMAVGDWQKAAVYFGVFAQHPSTTAFQLAGTIRQLEQVWRIRPDNDRPGQVLNAMRTRLLELQNGAIDLAPAEARALQKQLSESDTTAKAIFESVLGGAGGPSKLVWWEKGLQRARSVARINNLDNNTVGTGFIVRGSDLDPKLGSELLLLTNNHVVGTVEYPYYEYARRACLFGPEARIAFDLEDDRANREPMECDVLWTSPTTALDATLLRIKDRNNALRRLEDLRYLPLADGPPRVLTTDKHVDGDPKPVERPSQVLIIGHTGGDDLHISWRNNEVVSKGCRIELQGQERTPKILEPEHEFLHYTAPTRRGNSGSPVFEEAYWNVVALHHRGETSEALHDNEGAASSAPIRSNKPYKANEGILITSIRKAVQKAQLPPRA